MGQIQMHDPHSMVQEWLGRILLIAILQNLEQLAVDVAMNVCTVNSRLLIIMKGRNTTYNQIAQIYPLSMLHSTLKTTYLLLAVTGH
jgi:hypothetical protein